MPKFNKDVMVSMNGKLTPAADAKVNLFDRGFLYGDSLYEVIRTWKGKLFEIEAHLARLQKSAELCQMKLDQSPDQYREEIEKAAKGYRKKFPKAEDLYCRLIVTRGIGKIGFDLKCIESPTQFYIVVQPLDTFTPIQVKKGLNLQISSRLRNNQKALDPAMKSGNYLNSVLAYLEAASQGYDDAILCNENGEVTEGTTFNVFMVKDGEIRTAPLDIGILDGITRRGAIETIQKEGLAFSETRFSSKDLESADEAFITSTIKTVYPITAVNGTPIGTGEAGPLALKLRDLYHAYCDERSNA